MPDIFDRLASKESSPKTNQKQDVFDRLSSQSGQQIPSESWDNQAKRWANQIPLALAQTFTWPLDAIEGASQEVLRQVSEDDPDVNPAIAEAARQGSRQKYFPSQHELEQKIETSTGMPLEAKTRGQRLLRLGTQVAQGRLGDPKSFAPIARGALAPAISATAEKLGAPEGVSDVTGALAAGLFPGGAKKLPSPKKAASTNKNPPGSPPPIESEVERLPSGLTKSKAIEAKHPEKAIITPDRQKKAIRDLNQESAKITKETIEKRLPLAKKIQEGHDFKSEFKEGFDELHKTASKANPSIDITDVVDYLDNYTKKYRGFAKELIPEDARKSLSLAKAFRNNPQTRLKKLLDLYRFNNSRLDHIYETSFVQGKRKEMADFLVGMNKSIAKSFERTLPSESPNDWVNKFKELNSNFSGYIKASETLNKLESALQGRMKASAWEKIATNPKIQRQLSYNMGREGADEIIQLAKDMTLARQSLKAIPVKDWKVWDSIFPLSAFVPGVHVPGAAAAAKKGVDYGRRIYGWYLTTPQRRQAMDQAAKAIQKGDKKAYENATKELKKDISVTSQRETQISNLNDQLADASRKVSEARANQLRSDNYDPVEQFTLMAKLEKAMKDEQKIRSAIQAIDRT